MSEPVRTASLAFFVRLPQYSRPVSHDRTNRLYQWLSQRASFFRPDASGYGTSRTVRTEVTVQREGITLLVGDAAAASIPARFAETSWLRRRRNRHGFVFTKVRFRRDLFRLIGLRHEFRMRARP